MVSSGPDDILFATVAWIERHLDRALTVELIARQAGLSPYHFSRLFTARMGHGVMTHVRGRRLVRSARRMTADPAPKLIDLAFECGFDSQEAFTRAFKRVFGVSPGRFRQGFDVAPIEGQFPMHLPETPAGEVVQLPDLARLAAFDVAGFSRHFDHATKSDIPQLWARLIGSLPIQDQLPSMHTYGVVWSADRETGGFQYLAGVGVQANAPLPEGFERIAIPAATYLVFRITLNGGGIHTQVKAAMNTIWGTLIPASGLALADSPDFELYDGRIPPTQAGATIDFHVPVAR